MARLAGATTLQRELKFSRLLIIDSHNTIRATSCKLGSIWLVVDSEELVELIVNGVEEFATGSVPVLQAAVGVDRDEHVLCHTWSNKWAPPKYVLKSSKTRGRV